MGTLRLSGPLFLDYCPQGASYEAARECWSGSLRQRLRGTGRPCTTKEERTIKRNGSNSSSGVAGFVTILAVVLLARGKLILQEWEVKIQRLEIWLLVLKVMTQQQE